MIRRQDPLKSYVVHERAFVDELPD